MTQLMTARGKAFSLFALTLFLLAMAVVSVGSAKEVRFVAREFTGQQEIWTPNSVIITQATDLKEPLYFVLENPTPLEHAFAVTGLYMVLPEEIMPSLQPNPFTGEVTAHAMAPLRVMIKGKETRKVEVAPVGLEGSRNLGARYPFFCPIHRDITMSGFIFVD